MWCAMCVGSAMSSGVTASSSFGVIGGLQTHTVHYRHLLPVVVSGVHCLKNFAGALLQGERMRRTAHSFPQVF